MDDQDQHVRDPVSLAVAARTGFPYEQVHKALAVTAAADMPAAVAEKLIRVGGPDLAVATAVAGMRIRISEVARWQ